MKILIRLNVKSKEWKECYLKTKYLGIKENQFRFITYLYPTSWDIYGMGYKDGFAQCSDNLDLEDWLEDCKLYIEANYE